jgi:hypothetical protein
VRRARHALLSRALADPKDQSSAELAGQDKVATTFADCAAHLVMMDRYERRALSRRKFAIRIRCCASAGYGINRETEKEGQNPDRKVGAW